MNPLDVVLASKKDIMNWLVYEASANEVEWDPAAVKAALRRKDVRKALRGRDWFFYPEEVEILRRICRQLKIRFRIVSGGSSILLVSIG